jgi:hypothetical protein
MLPEGNVHFFIFRRKNKAIYIYFSISLDITIFWISEVPS